VPLGAQLPDRHFVLGLPDEGEVRRRSPLSPRCSPLPIAAAGNRVGVVGVRCHLRIAGIALRAR
jgi:hypothetical protein